MSKQEVFKHVAVGTVLARKYRVEKVLGIGGMGIVVAATHLDLREMRAIKLIRPDAINDQAIERLLREARAVVRLKSEHVAEVYDLGRLESGTPYIVMELLEGQDLSAMLKARGPLPIADAVLYVTQACHAVAEAHALGIVHRDLKPGNLFVTRRQDGSECVKVLDFGISKDTKSVRYDPEMTGAQDLMGSPLYMSPEQMRSARKVDPRADVWALGAILYKLLTGRAPFQAPTIAEIYALTLGKQVRPPSSWRSEIPKDLDNIIVRCLDKQRPNRYPTAAELGAALVGHASREKANAESNSQGPTRRSTIPPPAFLPPVFIEVDISEYDERTSEVNLAPAPVASPAEVSEPMMGLARSNKIIRSGTSSFWNGIGGFLRPASRTLLVAISIFSALVGAILASAVPLPAISGGSWPHEPKSTPEVATTPSVTLLPPVLPSSVPSPHVSASPVPIAPLVASSTIRVAPPPKMPKRPPLASSAPAKSAAPILAKPKRAPIVDDPIPDRD